MAFGIARLIALLGPTQGGGANPIATKAAWGVIVLTAAAGIAILVLGHDLKFAGLALTGAIFFAAVIKAVLQQSKGALATIVAWTITMVFLAAIVMLTMSVFFNTPLDFRPPVQEYLPSAPGRVTVYSRATHSSLGKVRHVEFQSVDASGNAPPLARISIDDVAAAGGLKSDILPPGWKHVDAKFQVEANDGKAASDGIWQAFPRLDLTSLPGEAGSAPVDFSMLGLTLEDRPQGIEAELWYSVRYSNGRVSGPISAGKKWVSDKKAQ